MSSSEESNTAYTSISPPAAVPTTVLDRAVWHRKSKQGCRTCKLRKVKCDESRPLCRNCAKRFPSIQSCDFDRPTLEAAASSTITLSQNVNSRPNHIHESNRLRMLELRLMYHYTKTAAFDLPDHGSPLCHGLWDETIPQVAFSSDLVLSAILALSALHLRAVKPDEPELQYAAGHYFGQVVKKYRPALAHITESMAEPLLMTAMIIGFYTWLSSCTPNLGAPYQLPLQSLYLAPNLRWIFEKPPVEDLDSPATTYFLTIYLQDKDRFMNTVDDSVLPEDKEVYIAAINYITSICNGFAKGAPEDLLCHKISYVIPHLPLRFLALLSQKDPRAMALIARVLALLRLIEWRWWLHGPKDMKAEEYHVRGICELMPIEWLWAMDWPLKVVSGRLGVRDEDVTDIKPQLQSTPAHN